MLKQQLGGRRCGPFYLGALSPGGAGSLLLLLLLLLQEAAACELSPFVSVYRLQCGGRWISNKNVGDTTGTAQLVSAATCSSSSSSSSNSSNSSSKTKEKGLEARKEKTANSRNTY